MSVLLYKNMMVFPLWWIPIYLWWIILFANSFKNQPQKKQGHSDVVTYLLCGTFSFFIVFSLTRYDEKLDEKFWKRYSMESWYFATRGFLWSVIIWLDAFFCRADFLKVPKGIFHPSQRSMANIWIFTRVGVSQLRSRVCIFSLHIWCMHILQRNLWF